MKTDSRPKWLKISLSCPENALEAVVDLVGVLSGSGVEELPVKDGRSTITGFFQLSEAAAEKQIVDHFREELAALCKLYAMELPELTCSTMKDEDWATSWQQFFKTFAIIPGLIIKPGWEAYLAAPGEKVIEMDPGMAFGTGQHASTKLALSLLDSCFQDSRPETVLDIGTGTGILAMAAALFGAEKVIAIDNDPDAVEVAVKNIVHNRLEQSIMTSVTPLAEISGSFACICANIIHDVLKEMAPVIAGLLVPGSRLVLAGILRGEQEQNIIAVYQELGVELQQAAYEDEWVSLLLQKELTR
jgi:ribosomal protein L11 methyltransferase